MTTFNELKEKTAESVNDETELVQESEWIVNEKLDEDEVIDICREQDLFEKSPTSYDSAYNHSMMKIMRQLIADKLKRDIKP